jgi:hypothetical protein
MTVYAVLWGLAKWGGPSWMFLLELVLIVGSVALIYLGTFYGISRLPRPRNWRCSAIILLCTGTPIGLWVGGGFRYPASPVHELEAIGFPIRLVIFKELQNGVWVWYDHVGNTIVVFLNAFLIAAVFILPVSVALIVRASMDSR